MRRKAIALTVLAATVAVIVAMPESAKAPARRAIQDAFAPFLLMISDAVGVIRDLSAGAGAMRAENARLSMEAGAMRIELHRLREADRENRELREQLGFARRFGYRVVPAEVVARDLNAWWHTVRIDRGRVSGVEPGMPVISAQGLVGRTIEVAAYTSDVLLLVDPASRVSARLTKSDGFGLLRGMGAARGAEPMCRLDFVSKDIDVQIGDEVVTSGLGRTYPRGLAIGHVERVFMDRSGLFQCADVRISARIGDLRYLYVIEDPAWMFSPAGDGRED